MAFVGALMLCHLHVRMRAASCERLRYETPDCVAIRCQGISVLYPCTFKPRQEELMVMAPASTGLSFGGGARSKVVFFAIARLNATTAELVVCGPDGARRFGVHSFVGKESLPQACLVCRCWLWRYSASFFGWMRACSLVALWHTGRRMSLYRLDRFDGLRQHRERLCISIVLGAVAACYPPIWAHTLMWHLASTTDGRPPRPDGERTR